MLKMIFLSATKHKDNSRRLTWAVATWKSQVDEVRAV